VASDLLVGCSAAACLLLVVAASGKAVSLVRASANRDLLDEAVVIIHPSLKRIAPLVVAMIALLEYLVVGSVVVSRFAWWSECMLALLGGAFMIALIRMRRQRGSKGCGCMGALGRTQNGPSSAALVRAGLVMAAGILGALFIDSGAVVAVSAVATVSFLLVSVVLCVVSPEVGNVVRKCKGPLVLARRDALVRLRRSATYRSVDGVVPLVKRPVEAWSSECTDVFAFQMKADQTGKALILFASGVNGVRTSMVELPDDLVGGTHAGVRQELTAQTL
jgi:methylamine utilization protein MauE